MSYAIETRSDRLLARHSTQNSIPYCKSQLRLPIVECHTIAGQSFHFSIFHIFHFNLHSVVSLSLSVSDLSRLTSFISELQSPWSSINFMFPHNRDLNSSAVVVALCRPQQSSSFRSGTKELNAREDTIASSCRDNRTRTSQLALCRLRVLTTFRSFFDFPKVIVTDEARNLVAAAWRKWNDWLIEFHLRLRIYVT